MTYSLSEAQHDAWHDRHGWEEELVCPNDECRQQTWKTLVFSDDLPSDPDCPTCGEPGIRLDT